MKNLPLLNSCLALLVFLIGCSEDTPELVKESSKPLVTKQDNGGISPQSDFDFPNVYVEELDQTQEFYKEQHETSFSFVTDKNWFSYTASKDGILTKVLFFGKPNFQPSDHYGDSMHGFIREGNPDTGAKFGEWDLSRDDIVNQLSAQGINDREAGWITIRMKGKIPQVAGKTYFFVCEKITGGKPWFGAFAFGEGNPYQEGKFWLHPDHDLVFRTYVGKTPEQVTKDQKNKEIIKALGVEENDVPANPSDLPTPFPISQTSNNVVIQQADPVVEALPAIEPINDPKNILVDEQVATPPIQTEQLDLIQIPSAIDNDLNKSEEKRSLFNRLFKK